MIFPTFFSSFRLVYLLVPPRLSRSTVPPVPIASLLTHTLSATSVDMHCPACAKTTSFEKTMSFRTLPEVLAVRAERFRCLDGWVPRRVGVAIAVDPDAEFQVTAAMIGSGIADGETALPEGGGDSSSLW
jgi:uncharacterized UBP type Zn finger protein